MSGSAVVHRTTAMVLLVLSLLVVVTTLIGNLGTVGLLVTVLFALSAPGWAVVAFWRPASPSLEWTAATGLSLAITIVVAMTMLVTTAWYPQAVMVGLALLTAGTLAFHLARTDLVGWSAS